MRIVMYYDNPVIGEVCGTIGVNCQDGINRAVDIVPQAADTYNMATVHLVDSVTGDIVAKTSDEWGSTCIVHDEYTVEACWYDEDDGGRTLCISIQDM